ncbi:unannotated protein [freshwater metagenome]|uniref:Unannotated protein n=1 Tax=freshwater metagenome TaxID=449393 RepID=A0A6J6NRH5_9ZZZZ
MPTVGKVRRYDAPVPNVPLLNPPPVWVTVWGSLSLFDHTTVAPVITLIEVGAKARLAIFTEAVVGVGVGGVPPPPSGGACATTVMTPL